MKLYKSIIICGLIILLIAISACTSNSKYSVEQRDALAKCLSKKNIKMYGAFWCPNCANQKKLFAESFKYIDYVECDPKGPNPQPELCKEKKIEAYPTWIVEGKKLVGLQPLETLNRISNCQALQTK